MGFYIVPFGVTDAFAQNSKKVFTVFAHLLEILVAVSLDDILIISKTPQEHISNII